MINEIWKDVVGYEGLYEVSNLGNVRASANLHKKRVFELVKPYEYKGGYIRVCLCKNGIQKKHYVHRLVASAFLGSSNLLVNHIDSDRSNNNINNLEFVTTRDNAIHGLHCLKKQKRSSKYVGVCWNKKAKKWYSQIQIKDKRKHLGSFDNELNAYNAYLNALQELNETSKYASNN